MILRSLETSSATKNCQGGKKKEREADKELNSLTQGGKGLGPSIDKQDRAALEQK